MTVGVHEMVLRSDGDKSAVKMLRKLASNWQEEKEYVEKKGKTVMVKSHGFKININKSKGKQDRKKKQNIFTGSSVGAGAEIIRWN